MASISRMDAVVGAFLSLLPARLPAASKAGDSLAPPATMMGGTGDIGDARAGECEVL